MSYPALYTHKRNKHNIIPITGKQDIFKNKKEVKSPNLGSVIAPKYRYSALETFDDLSAILSSIKAVYSQVFEEIYMCKESLLFREGLRVDDHEGFNLLLNYENKVKDSLVSGGNMEKILPCCSVRKEDDPVPKIDDVFISYMINFFKVMGDSTELNLLVAKFFIVFREYLNITGWDYKKNFIKYEVSLPLAENGSYTQCNDCEDIPDLINNFLSVFIRMDKNMFNISMKELLDIIKNFCNWLFVNNLTNFKIAENDTDRLESMAK